MKYYFSFNKLALGLLSIIDFRLSFASHFLKNSVFRIENRIHIECLEMSKEIRAELTDAKILLVEKKVEKDILICYNKIFTSIYVYNIRD